MVSQIYVSGMSRSGTTLLTTVIDAHPDVSMGYELLTKGIDDAGAACQLIMDHGPADARTCSDRLRDVGHEQLAALVHRAERALVSPTELAGILRDLSAQGQNNLSSLAGRATLAGAIVSAKARQEQTSITGYKLNAPRIGEFDRLVDEEAVYVGIVRDPRDVWRSHVENDFGRSAQEVARTWNTYLRRFAAFTKRHPDRCHLVRYEDLVRSPGETLDALCRGVGLRRDESMDRFYDSKASVLRGGHVNSAALARDFFTDSVGRWEHVAESDLRTLESACYSGMDEHGYRRATDSGFRFTERECAKQRVRLEKKRRYFLGELTELLGPATRALPHRTWREATTPATSKRPDDVLVIRHDIDQDIETAVRMARWESEQGIRATYCVLHTAWYYGRFKNRRLTARSEDMVEACLEIQSLGHEINLHNNAVVAGLRTGADPFDILGEELDFLRGRGLDVTGTSTHGDPLCRTLGFRNLEMFSECVDPDAGGVRAVEHESQRVVLGERSMSELGLTYEGYDLPRDIYISDSGGTLRAETRRPGRPRTPGSQQDVIPAYRRVVGILVHPVWWDFDNALPTGRPDVSYRNLVQSAAARYPISRQHWVRNRLRRLAGK